MLSGWRLEMDLGESNTALPDSTKDGDENGEGADREDAQRSWITRRRYLQQSSRDEVVILVKNVVG
jgi:hypothetical protein